MESARPGGRTRNVEKPPVTANWDLQIPGETYVLYVRGVTTAATFAIDGIGGKYIAEQFNPRTGERTHLSLQQFAEQVDQSQIAAVGGTTGNEPASGHRSARLANRYTFIPPDAGDWLVVVKRSL